MEIKEFVETLGKSNFSLAVENEKLVLKGASNKLSKDEIQAIKENKFVINYIRKNKNELVKYLSIFPEKLSKEKSKSISAIYKLSGLQQGMLFYSLYNSESGAYIEQFSCDLVGADVNVLNKSWDYILKQHTILRSAFYYDEFEVPVQGVHREVSMPVEILDYRTMNDVEKASAISIYEESDRKKGFDMKRPPLMRVGLIRLTEDKYRMYWTSHHLLYDGWSFPILVEEFLQTYELLIAGKEVVMGEEDKYEEFIHYLDRIDKAREEKYWRTYMAEVEYGTLLPFIKTSPERTKGIGTYKSALLRLDETVQSKIDEYAKRHQITVNTIMQGVWSYLLSQYTSADHVIYGTTVSGRPDDLPGVERRVGMYINTLPVHENVQHDQEITDWLKNLQQRQVSSRSFQHTALPDIQKWSGIKGDLFDSLLVFENYPLSKIVEEKKWSLQVENIQFHEHTNYPLNILIGSSTEIAIRFNYNSNLLHERYIRQIQNHFEHVLMQIIGGSKKYLKELILLTASEKIELLNELNVSKRDFPKDKTIVDLFEDQVVKTPDDIAIEFENEELTYQQLDERSNQLAHYLRNFGVKEETLVPVCIERSANMMVAIMGIMKAGGAYVPIDPAYPAERINFMLNDTAALAVVSSKKSKAALPAVSSEIISLDEDWEEIQKQPLIKLAAEIKPAHLAYIIYTSGSTGVPKGVMIEHRGVVNLINAQSAFFNINKDDRILQFSNYCFDASVEQIFLAFFNGVPLILFPEGLQSNEDAFEHFLNEKKISHLHATPAFLENLNPGYYENLKRVIAGGDVCKKALSDKWKNNNVDFYNEYGPTETTVTAIEYHANNGDLETSNSLPIGKAIGNLQLYIINRTGALCPVGIAGELCISGVGVARGYLNRPELTSEKFVRDPYYDGARLYKTGDICRWLPDGNIEFFGRVDDQVKIRGYRIELDEINSVIQQSKLVREAIVLVKSDKDGNNRLVGYVVSKESFNKEALLACLRDRLPAYMIPALWVEIDHLPLTSNGKIDKKSLPEPDAAELLSNEFVAPRNELESKLAEIWKRILGVERVGVRDNFFELGGHSLLIMRLISVVKRDLKVDVPVNALFELFTVEELAKYIKLVQNKHQPQLQEYDTIKL